MPYGYITKLSDKLTREHIRYNNRYGIAIAADIYYAKDIDKNAKYPALINEGLEIREIDFQNRASLEKAFAGIDTFVYVAGKTYSVFDRVGELENVLAAMKTNGIKNLVAMSFIADQEDNPFVMSPFYGYLPRRLAGTDLNYAIAKNSLYADPLVPYLPELIERKGLIYPVGKQAMSFITLEDSAEAMATMALNKDVLNSRRTYLLTQRRSYTMPELGAMGKTSAPGQLSIDDLRNAENYLEVK